MCLGGGMWQMSGGLFCPYLHILKEARLLKLTAHKPLTECPTKWLPHTWTHSYSFRLDESIGHATYSMPESKTWYQMTNLYSELIKNWYISKREGQSLIFSVLLFSAPVDNWDHMAPVHLFHPDISSSVLPSLWATWMWVTAVVFLCGYYLTPLFMFYLLFFMTPLSQERSKQTPKQLYTMYAKLLNYTTSMTSFLIILCYCSKCTNWTPDQYKQKAKYLEETKCFPIEFTWK